MYFKLTCEQLNHRHTDLKHTFNNFLCLISFKSYFGDTLSLLPTNPEKI